MRNAIILKSLFFLLSSLFLTNLHAQFEDEEYDPFKKSYAEKVREFNNDLSEARQYFQEQDDQALRAKAYNKIDKGLQGFLETEFMKSYKEIKLEIESLAASFKAQSQNLKPEDVVRVRKAYAQLSDKFNILLHDIKKDFMDGKKLKHISKYPDMYSASLELRLRDLKDDFSNDFEGVIADILETDEFSAPFMAIFGVIKFAVDFTQYLTKIRYNNRKIKEEHLNEFFVEPYRFRKWEEIEAISARIFDDSYNNNDYDDNYDNYSPEQDSMDNYNPFEDDINSASPKGKTQKKKKGNNKG